MTASLGEIEPVTGEFNAEVHSENYRHKKKWESDALKLGKITGNGL